MEGFERAVQHDLKKAAGAAKRRSNDSRMAQKEPTEVVLYGYAQGDQWAAIDHYEKVSNGRICEDYERNPPIELRKYPASFSGSNVRSAPFTQAARTLACQYRGGDCWIKVTFESAEAADRAINNSPHCIQGHWVYAQAFHGAGPEFDQPIQSRQADGQQPADLPSTSSSTASSATATAPVLRNRTGAKAATNQPRDDDGDAAAPKPPPNPFFFTHFPTIPKTVLRPAHEAFLPHPTWFERQINRLCANGWLPGDMIGNVIPLTDNGDFDWANASLYWRFFYWIDSKLGTNICAMKDDDDEVLL